MKWLRSLTIAALLVALSPTRPAAANLPYPPDCYRDISIFPVWKHEGSVSQHETGFTWFAFTVRADGCIFTGATVVFKTVHLSTDDDDLIAEEGTSVRWELGDLTARTVYVRVLKDYLVEPDEEFALKVVCAYSTGISGGAFAKARVINDDGPTPGSEPVPYNYHCRQ
jgi:hypothetical protein